MSRTRRAALLVALTGSAALAATAVVGPVSAQEDGGLRAATAIASKYASVERATADGFVPTRECVSAPGLGYMGYHFVNPSRFDRRLEPGRPEVVLYKMEDGKPVLAGVEYLLVDADQDLGTDEHPKVFGHEPGMPVHYDLHVWTHDHNPDGAWSAWNTSPDLSCP